MQMLMRMRIRYLPNNKINETNKEKRKKRGEEIKDIPLHGYAEIRIPLLLLFS